MTTKNQAHSPLPWRIGDSGQTIFPSSSFKVICSGSRDDIKLIVKAVDCHTELLEALKNLELLARKKLDQSATQEGLQACGTLAMARKAISKAQGEV